MIALLLGNILFVSRVIIGIDIPSSIKMTFFISNIVSASITILFFWNKVQSWQLATTSMKDKGLVARQMRNFNRGRGTLAMLAYTIFPVVVRKCPPEWLSSVSFSTVFAIFTLGLTTKTYLLIRDYGKTLFLAYGMLPAAVAVTILHYRTIENMLEAHPQLLDHFEKQSYFIVACVQFGFMWYYFYSRRMVSKQLVQNMCKNYHPTIYLIYAVRLTMDRWWATMPVAIMFHSVLITLLGLLFFVKIVKTQLKNATVKVEVQPESTSSKRRRSSIFEAEGIQTRRRSSLFEAIDS
jgi:hypothetical protein